MNDLHHAPAAPAIVVVGLGPGDAGLLTRDTLDWLASSRPVWLRTHIHPTVAQLPDAARRADFDALYEHAQNFDIRERMVLP